MTNAVLVQWHYEAFNDLLDVLVVCSNRRLLLSPAQIHTFVVQTPASILSVEGCERPSERR